MFQIILRIQKISKVDTNPAKHRDSFLVLNDETYPPLVLTCFVNIARKCMYTRLLALLYAVTETLAVEMK